jgi:hypothetical protein
MGLQAAPRVRVNRFICYRMPAGTPLPLLTDGTGDRTYGPHHGRRFIHRSSGPTLNVRAHMDPAELIDSRPNDGPLALWGNKIVLSVHQDGAGAMPTEWKIVTDRLVHDILSGLIGAQ